MAGLIEWYEDERGEGRAKLTWDDGSTDDVPCEWPITSRTDASEITNRFGLIPLTTTHDGAFIHVTT